MASVTDAKPGSKILAKNASKTKYRLVFVEWSVVKNQLCKPGQTQRFDELYFKNVLNELLTF